MWDPFGSHHALNWALKNLAMCNKRFRRITLPSLYHDVRLNAPDRIYPFILCLVDSPHYGSLVRRISIGVDNTFRRNLRIKKGQITESDTSKILEKLKELSLPAALIKKVGETEDADWAVALCLLPLLTKLEGFSIQFKDSKDRQDFNAHAPIIFQPHFLSPSLRSVYLEVDRCGWMSLNVEVLTSLMSIPSIKEISVSRIGSGIEPRDTSLPFPPSQSSAHPHSNVETLRISESMVSENTITTLLGLSRSLTKFVYIERRWLETPRSLRRFQEAINNVSSTIEKLALELGGSVFVPNRILSFSNFTSLVELSISWDLLFDQDPGDIINRLPSSLETLLLRSPQRYEDGVNAKIIECFTVILRAKSVTVLPHLDTIAVNDPTFDWTSFMDMASERGVKIRPWDPVDQLMSDPYVMSVS
ncbi:498_t:CDS:1 [Acaulospora colombiana]|uniref:498_t:CDS:1 n=1 Tax=Acaulospora colombiana TaxID=27376 RepID=A0ACA9PN13_9GLOM|nr:498_t:CDS:1 [Acaulospora colombiana]